MAQRSRASRAQWAARPEPHLVRRHSGTSRSSRRRVRRMPRSLQPWPARRAEPGLQWPRPGWAAPRPESLPPGTAAQRHHAGDHDYEKKMPHIGEPETDPGTLATAATEVPTGAMVKPVSSRQTCNDQGLITIPYSRLRLRPKETRRELPFGDAIASAFSRSTGVSHGRYVSARTNLITSQAGAERSQRRLTPARSPSLYPSCPDRIECRESTVGSERMRTAMADVNTLLR